MKAFSVNIISLSLKAHQFDFVLDDAFFKAYGDDIVSSGEYKATVVLTRKETFIEARFTITGKARLICDRSLEPFDFPQEIDRKIIFKYGEEETELSDEIVVIRQDRATLDLGQYLYEYIVLEIPMKKLHPRFRDDEDDDEWEGKMVYTSEPEEISQEEETDPSCEQLK